MGIGKQGLFVRHKITVYTILIIRCNIVYRMSIAVIHKTITAWPAFEMFGNLQGCIGSKYIEEIRQDTPILLELCSKYAEKLAPLATKEEETVKEPIAPEELAEAWESLREVAQVFDYDSLSYILKELSSYRLTEEDEKRLQAIRSAAEQLAWEEISKILS